MSGLAGGKSSGGGGLAKGSGSSVKTKTPHGAFGFVENLGRDVKDAVTGIPTGLVMTATHPIRSIKAMGKMTWQDWKPLVEGHPGQWAHQTYMHPLAPLLDVATLFSAGVGGGARVADALDAAGADARLIKAAAGLRRSSTRVVRDTQGAAKADEARAAVETAGGHAPRSSFAPPGSSQEEIQARIDAFHAPRHDPGAGMEGAPITKTYGTNAAANLRRAIGTRALAKLESKGALPKWYTAASRESRLYHRLVASEDAHKLFSHHVQTHGLMQASAMMGDEAAQRLIQPALLEHSHDALKRFAREVSPTHTLTKDEAFVGSDSHVAAHLKYDPMRPDLAQRFDRLGRDLTTRDARHAAQADNGNLLVIRKDAAKNMSEEGAKSTRFVRGLLPNATKWWKRINVGYAPRTITNNTVGNYFMYAMKAGGHGASRGLIDAIRHTRGDAAAMKAFKDMHGEIHAQQGTEKAAEFLAAAHPALHPGGVDTASIERAFGHRAAEAVKNRPNWIAKYFKNEIGNTFGNALHQGEKEATGKVGKAVQSGFYPIVHRIADQPIRVAGLYQFMRRAPEVKAFLKTHPGVGLDDAISSVLEKNTGHVMERATEHVRSIAGDYVTRTAGEQLVQNLVPFYLWDKHVVKHVGNLANEAPGRLAAAQGVSQLGNAENEKLLGKLPEFMKGVLPLSLLGVKGAGGRVPLLSTQGLNPYSTAGDTATAVAALTGGMGKQTGEDAASNLSPLLSGLVEQISGHRIGSDAPAPRHGGVIPSVLANTAEGLGYAKLIERALGGGSHGKNSSGEPTLYGQTPLESASGLIGLPLKQANLAAAAKLWKQEQDTITKKKKPKRRY